MKSFLSCIYGSYLRIQDCIASARNSYFGSVLVFCLPCIFLIIVCSGFDYASKIPQIYQDDISRALIDNLGHAVIAAVCWWILVGKKTLRDKVDILCCGILSSIIDVDHFIMARSFKMKDALHLQHRPFLHNSCLVPLGAPAIQVWIVQLFPASLQSLPFIFIIAVTTHHLRDASRRGLWFWPFGSTPPLPYGLYIILILITIGFVKEARAIIQRLPAVSNTGKVRTIKTSVIQII